MTDRQRITLACFLAYFVMSAMLAPIGIISTPLGEHYGLSVAQMTDQFSALTIGILIGAIAALSFSGRTRLRRVLLVLYIAMSVLLALLATQPALLIFKLCLLLLGTGCGLGLAAAAATISQLYEGNARAAVLVATDGCFSLAGVVIPWITIRGLGVNLPAGRIYIVIAGAAVALVLLVALSRLSAADAKGPADLQPAGNRWPMAAWLGIGALTVYTLGQYSVLFWLPAHLDAAFSIPVSQGGALVGRFWTGMFIAQIAVALTVLKLGTRRLLAFAALATALGSIPLWNTGSLSALHWLSLAWGIANLGLLKLTLTFVTLQFQSPTPRLVSCVLLGATLGTAISPAVTSSIVELAGTRAPLQFGTACHVVMALMLIVALSRPSEEPS